MIGKKSIQKLCTEMTAAVHTDCIISQVISLVTFHSIIILT